jgi:hypothetical protein
MVEISGQGLGVPGRVGRGIAGLNGQTPALGLKPCVHNVSADRPHSAPRPAASTALCNTTKRPKRPNASQLAAQQRSGEHCDADSQRPFQACGFGIEATEPFEPHPGAGVEPVLGSELVKGGSQIQRGVRWWRWLRMPGQAAGDQRVAVCVSTEFY